MRRAVMTLLLWGAGAFAQPVLLTGASASGTWDSNVTRTARPEGGLFFDATAYAGGGAPLLDDRVLVTALALYRGRAGTALDALSSHVFVGSVAGSVLLAPWLRAGLSGGGGYTVMSDPTRNGPRLDARAFLRAMPLAWLDVRAGYGFLLREAADPAFATRNHEVLVGVEVRPLAWLELSANWTFTIGGDGVFLASTTTSSGRGRWSSGDTLWVPTPTEARAHALGASALALLPKGFGVGVEVTWLTSENAVQPWTGWVGSLVLSWELP